MTTINTTCPDCGDVQVTQHDIRMRLCENNRQLTYSFRCPSCGLATCNSVDESHREKVFTDLRSVGVSLQMWTLPQELGERHNGPALTVDDELDFERQLACVTVCEDIPGWYTFLR